MASAEQPMASAGPPMDQAEPLMASEGQPVARAGPPVAPAPPSRPFDLGHGMEMPAALDVGPAERDAKWHFGATCGGCAPGAHSPPSASDADAPAVDAALIAGGTTRAARASKLSLVGRGAGLDRIRATWRVLATTCAARRSHRRSGGHVCRLHVHRGLCVCVRLPALACVCVIVVSGCSRRHRPPHQCSYVEGCVAPR